MSNILNDLFNPKVKLEDSSTGVTEFRPNYKKGQGGVYYAHIRFIPNPADPIGKSIIHKYTAYIKNPLTNQGTSVDCPSSVGQPDPIVDAFFALKKSPNAMMQEMSSNFSRKSSYASLVQVLKCDAEPELENKILVWRYGQKVYQKIYNEMNPKIGTPTNPFDLINGRIFEVNIHEVSGYNNYDNCQFVSANGVSSAMRIIVKNPNTGQEQVTSLTPEFISNEKGQQFVLKYLQDNAPDMSQYEYHEWTPETAKFVNDMIQMYLSGNALNSKESSVALDSIMGNNNAMAASSPQVTAKSANPINQNNPQPNGGSLSLDDLGLGGLQDLLKDEKEDKFPQAKEQKQNKGSEDTDGLSMGLNLDDILGSTFGGN